MANTNKKQHTVREGFGFSNLLSPAEVTLMRAISRNYKMEINKDEFNTAKSDFRAVEIVSDSFAKNYIDNTTSMIVLSREEQESIARGDD